MKTIVINVQDNKYQYFRELLESMDFAYIQDEIEIPEAHKKVVRERIQKINENPERLLDWNKVKRQIKL